jgi:enoyl-CoA hydratase
MIERRDLDGVVVLTIDRHERRNALDTEHCDALRAAFERAVDDRARCVVLTGAGDAFCAGADFAEVGDASFRQAHYGTLQSITRLPVPVVAAVNGPAIGAGLQLAIASDLRVAAPAATFAIPSARLGVAVDPWTIHRLAALAGAGSAAWVLLASRELTADRAHEVGLVEQLGGFDDAVALAADLAAAAPLTLDYSKRALHAMSLTVDDAALTEAFAACWASADFAEGMRARAERRAPRFEGR